MCIFPILAVEFYQHIGKVCDVDGICSRGDWVTCPLGAFSGRSTHSFLEIDISMFGSRPAVVRHHRVHLLWGSACSTSLCSTLPLVSLFMFTCLARAPSEPVHRPHHVHLLRGSACPHRVHLNLWLHCSSHRPARYYCNEAHAIRFDCDFLKLTLQPPCRGPTSSCSPVLLPLDLITFSCLECPPL